MWQFAPGTCYQSWGTSCEARVTSICIKVGECSVIQAGKSVGFFLFKNCNRSTKWAELSRGYLPKPRNAVIPWIQEHLIASDNLLHVSLTGQEVPYSRIRPHISFNKVHQNAYSTEIMNTFKPLQNTHRWVNHSPPSHLKSGQTAPGQFAPQIPFAATLQMG